MRTDKQVYTIFSTNPEWLFELTGQPSPGPCRFESVSLKSIDQTADGVVIPDAPDAPWTVVEFQFQNDPTIYVRIVLEMALIQQPQTDREVQGLIFFLDEKLDPKTQPWCRVISSFSLTKLIEELSVRDPSHPLVAVFYPVLAETEILVEREAARCYTSIHSSSLSDKIKDSLVDVFVNWLEQRLKSKTKLEIEQMLLGQLPDLRETRSGKDLIEIGRNEGLREGQLKGKHEGKIEALLTFWDVKFGQISPQLKQRIEQIVSSEQLDQLYRLALTVKTPDEFVRKWPN